MRRWIALLAGVAVALACLDARAERPPLDLAPAPAAAAKAAAETPAPATSSPTAGKPVAPAPTSTDPHPDLAPSVRIQRRFVEKRRRAAVYVGFAYLARSDFYRSPGIEVAASYYLIESLAIDLRGAVLFSTPTAELNDFVMRTGFVPDTRAERATVLVGARWSFGYAKIRLSDKIALHFEPQLSLYGGIHVAGGPFAGTTVGPMGELGVGFLVFITRRFQARVGAGFTVAGEQRTRYAAVLGAYPVISVGAMF